ncbi:MAG: RsmB/NOP family class I SAM-dependent RNA methyltransferase [Aestuariivita sp.]|uniref:RsmB/NOP family class I SAM-dependent RNA methyltransferase n=1 Tax=Aestuariivita sp. TaxID=1872407 RepID=UPI003BAE33F1
MTPAARVQAAITILDEILTGKAAEQALTGWGRRSRYAGSKDRAAVRDLVFDAVRCRRSLAALGGGETGRGLMLGLARSQNLDVDALFDGSQYGAPRVGPDDAGRPPADGAEASDMPDWLWPEFQRSVGDMAMPAAAYLQERAPVFVRANLRRTNRAELTLALDQEQITAVPHALADTALEITTGARGLRNSSAFRDGLFELQDAASQAVVQALPLDDGQRVLDYCAGGGGKTLAMGARADLDLTACDSDPNRMRDLPERAARAGLAVRLADMDELDPAGGYDLVLCDAPCSGSGSWRRAPDGKWALTPERLKILTQTQDDILDRATGLVAEAGILAYATCSVLRVENEDRVDAFLSRHPDWKSTMIQSWPLAGGADGFFVALLARV